MGTRGPLPKNADRLAGHGAAKKRANEMRIVEVKQVPQPPLAELLGEVNPLTGQEWSQPTLRWWGEIGEFVKVQLLQDAQWSLFARAMMLDDAIQRGDGKYFAELRQEVSRFGISPADMARMRIQFAAADEAEDRMRGRRQSKKANPYEGLKAVNE